MIGLALPSPLPLPSLVQRRIDAAARVAAAQGRPPLAAKRPF